MYRYVCTVISKLERYKLQVLSYYQYIATNTSLILLQHQTLLSGLLQRQTHITVVYMYIL